MGRWLAVVLGVLGLGFGGFDAVVVRPSLLSLARTGRRVTGTAMFMGGAVKGPPHRARWAVAVDDRELGPQLVDGDGSLRAGEQVPLLCSTSAGRCERLSIVASYVERWPLTVNMERAAALLAAAVFVALWARWRRAEGGA